MYVARVYITLKHWKVDTIFLLLIQKGIILHWQHDGDFGINEKKRMHCVFQTMWIVQKIDFSTNQVNL